MTRLRLRDLAEDDRDLLLRWRNAGDVREASFTDREVTREEHDRWFDRSLGLAPPFRQVVVWQGAPVGVLQLGEGGPGEATYRWGCHLGERDAVPRGIGGALPALVMSVAFARLDARRVVGEVLATNEVMLGILERRGVRREGVLREAVLRRDSTPCDVHLFAVLRHEWADLRARTLIRTPPGLRAHVEACFDAI